MSVATCETTVNERLLGERYHFTEGLEPPQLTAAQRDARRRFLEELHSRRPYQEREACPFCGAARWTKIAEVESRGLPADTVICDACDGCFKAAVLAPEANAHYYRQLSCALRGKGLSKEARERLFQRRVESIATPRYRFIQHVLALEPGRDLVAELGCHDGANLVPWRQAGFEVVGVDLDPEAVAFGAGKGLPLVCADFMEDVSLADRRPKLVILSHLLEHVLDLGAVLERLYETVRPDGFVFIEVPGVRVQGAGNFLAYLDIEHNYHFEWKSLSRVLAHHRFRSMYADEFIRALCTTEEHPAPPAPRPAPWSVRRLAASTLGRCAEVLDGRSRTLFDVLQAGERRTLRAKLATTVTNAYFRFHYASITGIDEQAAQPDG